MSFAQKVKNEIACCEISDFKKAKSQLYGMLLFGSKLKSNKHIISVENESVIKRFVSLLNLIFPNLKYDYISSKKNLYTIVIENFNLSIDRLEIESPQYFLSGAFLVCGSITNPLLDYHLEFNVSSTVLCKKLISSFNFFENISFNPKKIKRRNNYSVYIKENEKISDFLALIGASTSAMEFMQVKMIKEVRNNINRSINFETANLSKITSSSSNQIKAIKKLIEHEKLSSLPYYLRETAILRLSNPYVSLKELSLLYEKPISKSGVNHRLKKLIDISKKI